MELQASVRERRDFLYPLLKLCFAEFLQPHHVRGNLPQLVIGAVRVMALHILPFLADAVPVHPLPRTVHPVVCIPAGGAPYLPLEAVRDRCDVPWRVQVQVLPDFRLPAGKPEFQVPVFHDGDAPDSLFKLRPIKFLHPKRLRRNPFQFFLAEIHAGAAHARLLFGAAYPVYIGLPPLWSLSSV